MSKPPCADCPWRKDAPLGVWPRERWLTLARTCRGDGQLIFACHKSPQDAPRVCLGWAAVEGDGAVGVRHALRLRKLDLAAVYARPEGIPLYESFDAMLAANGVLDAPDGRVSDLSACPDEAEMQALLAQVGLVRGARP